MRLPLVREDVVVPEARQIKLRTDRKEGKGGFGKAAAAFAFEHGVELRFECMQVQDVCRCVGKLLLGQVFCSPIRALLLFRQLDAKQLVRLDP